MTVQPSIRESLLNRFLRRSDVLTPPKHDLGPGNLWVLPRRHGLRPGTLGNPPPPSQLLAVNVAAEIHQHLVDQSKDYAHQDPGLLRIGPSPLSPSAMALLTKCDCVTETYFRGYGGEVVQIHDEVKGPIFVNLHPDDIRIVIEAGWGERHPHANDGLLLRLLSDKPHPISEYCVLIYPPRTHTEVETISGIIDAAVLFVAEMRVMAKEGKHKDGCPCYAEGMPLPLSFVENRQMGKVIFGRANTA